MELSIKPSDSLEGKLKAPPSKSYTIRALIAASIAGGESVIKDPLYSADTTACMDVCRIIGAPGEQKRDGLHVWGTGGVIYNTGTVLDTLNSGTTIRLMTAMSSLSDKDVTLTGDESIRSRPLGPLLDALKQLGVKASSRGGYPPVTVRGPLKGGVCRIRGDVSSQFISALLMACPLAKKDTAIILTTDMKSRPYVDMTLDLMGKFFVRVKNLEYRKFLVPGRQSYHFQDYTVEGDYSSAAFLLAAAALTESNVTVRNLFKESRQADKKLVEILRQMGVRLSVRKDSVRVKGDSSLEGVTVDLSDSPDLVPIMATLGSLAKGKTELVNVEHARIKECDRIHAMTVELSKMGADIKERPDGLIIKGKNLKAARIDGWRDHRIVMACAVAALKAKGETVIQGAEYVDVTFPDFVEYMKTLGARMTTR